VDNSPGVRAPGAWCAAHESKLRNSSHKLPNSRKKTNPNWPGSQQPGVFAPGAPATSRESLGVKTAENSQKFFHLSLDRSWSEGIYTRPGCLLTSRRTRKGGNAWFFIGDTHPSEAPAAGVVCLAAAALAALSCSWARSSPIKLRNSLY
jgi:hypothetical protein